MTVRAFIYERKFIMSDDYKLLHLATVVINRPLVGEKVLLTGNGLWEVVDVIHANILDNVEVHVTKCITTYFKDE